MFNCYNCNCELGATESITSDITGETYCEECYDHIFGTCEHCNNEEYRDNMTYVVELEEYLCQNCYDEYCNEREENENVIQPYHVRDIPVTPLYLEEELKEGMTEDDLLYFGFELEIYNSKNMISTNEMARKIREKYPELMFVFEKDSSLGYDSNDASRNGFEMIGQPMTIPFYRKNAEPKIEDILKMLSDNGFTSHNNNYCGLHIHFSRNYFKDNEDKYIQKLLLFFETYKEELKVFSRRKDFYWCEFVGDKTGYEKRFLKSSVILKDYAKDHPSHNIAINLGNTNTIEIRIFKGTLKFETLMASIELVDNIVRSVKNKETRKISLDNVINMTGTKYIKDYCNSKNIYNSAYLNDETKNVFKELEVKKQKIENTKDLTKENMTETLKELNEISKETIQNINFENDDIRTTFNILSQINSILSNRVRDVKSTIFEKDNTNIETSYKNYIGNYFNNPINFYESLIGDIGYIVNSSDTPLMNKLRDLYNNSKENIKTLKNMLNANESEE